VSTLEQNGNVIVIGIISLLRCLAVF